MFVIINADTCRRERNLKCSRACMFNTTQPEDIQENICIYYRLFSKRKTNIQKHSLIRLYLDEQSPIGTRTIRKYDLFSFMCGLYEVIMALYNFHSFVAFLSFYYSPHPLFSHPLGHQAGYLLFPYAPLAFSINL